MGGLMRACRPGPDFNTPPAKSDLNWPQSESDCFQLSVRFGRRVCSDLARVTPLEALSKHGACRLGKLNYLSDWPVAELICFPKRRWPRLGHPREYNARGCFLSPPFPTTPHRRLLEF